MSRGDQLGRQWQIIQTLLSSKRGKSALELSEELECNLRTVYRDLEALQIAGFPICNEREDGKNLWSLLDTVKQRDPSIFTKSGIMVGLGEERLEVSQVMDDMRVADIDFITIGQYLQPTQRHVPLDRYVTPDEFKKYERMAKGKGFLMVSASPLTRSSYLAGDDFAKLKAAREGQLAKRK